MNEGNQSMSTAKFSLSPAACQGGLVFVQRGHAVWSVCRVVGFVLNPALGLLVSLVMTAVDSAGSEAAACFSLRTIKLENDTFHESRVVVCNLAQSLEKRCHIEDKHSILGLARISFGDEAGLARLQP